MNDFQSIILLGAYDINNVAYNDGVIPGKPDPSIFLLAAKRAGAKKIVVVDSMKNNYAEKIIC